MINQLNGLDIINYAKTTKFKSGKVWLARYKLGMG